MVQFVEPPPSHKDQSLLVSTAAQSLENLISSSQVWPLTPTTSAEAGAEQHLDILTGGQMIKMTQVYRRLTDEKKTS